MTEQGHCDSHDHSHGGIFGKNSELIFAVACGTALLLGWLAGDSPSESPISRVSLVFYSAAYFFGGFFIIREAFQKILRGIFEIDFLMIVAAIGAAVLGAWGEGALLLFLFSLGHSLEHYAMAQARRAIEALAKLAPETATIQSDGHQFQVPIKDLKVGDLVIVKPNERVPADGFVVKGKSSIDQAPITGESIPVDKRPVEDPDFAAENSSKIGAESAVFAGTINGNGALEIQVTQLASNSTIARVIKMVSEAESQHSPTQQFTKKFERFYVPLVIGFVVLLHFAFLIIDESFSVSFYRAMAVLVAASPCALAISTPSAVLSGVARAAQGGVLVKGGAPLENLGRLESIAFDKTGTLTEGKLRITDVVGFQSPEHELLLNAVAVERLSDHPIASAVVRDGLQLLKGAIVPTASDLQSSNGRGVQAQVDSKTVFIGKHEWFKQLDGMPPPAEFLEIVKQLEADGRTTMVVRSNHQYLGVIGLMDTPRATAAPTIAKLRELGIKRMIMISGDNQKVVDAVGKAVGIDVALGDLMPDDKVLAIRELSKRGGVAMIGDGVNDAPAMANSTVGIAMGAAGSDVALETADVALMADDLSHLPFAVGLSRKTSRVIRQNLWFSLGMVAILIPATLLGLRLGLAVLFHEGSTVFVVFNALRLLAYKSK